MERGSVDVDGTRHSAKLAWRALALLQEELERDGVPVSRGSWVEERNLEEFLEDPFCTTKIGGTDPWPTAGLPG
jgi:hypothetical protein